MKKEEIHLNDIERILFGQAPGAFLLEVLIRTVIIYGVLLLVLKLMGKRMDGQISIIEMAVMIVLGAILGVGTQIPDRGILMAAAALLLIFIFQRGINWLNIKSRKIENITNGALNILVKDGVLQLDEMKAARITRQNLFASLRGRQIFSLGKVKRVYFEACGLINVYEDQADRSGLPVFPSNEDEFIKTKTRTDTHHIACKNCGWVSGDNRGEKACKNCGSKEWTHAIY
jgi:uncharacterized membrane protein YcaP (DUF421 family)